MNLPRMSESTSTPSRGVPQGQAWQSLAMPYGIAVLCGLVPVFVAPNELWWAAVAVMIVYTFAFHDTARRNNLLFEFADSIYYLGFTLSVGSLLAALRPFQTVAPNPEEVFHYFGLGMLTTLLGVVARTVLQMFYRTPSETLASVNESIADVASEFLRQLRTLQEQTAAELLRTTSAASEQVLPAVAMVAQQMDDVSAKILEANAHATGAVAPFDTLRDAVDDLVQRCRSIGVELLGVRKDLAEHGAKLDGAFAAPVQEFASAVSRASTEVQALSSRFTDAAFDTTPVKQSSVQLAASLDAARSQVIDLATSFRSSSRSMIDIGDSLQTANLGRRFSQLSEELVILGEAVRKQSKGVNEELNQNLLATIKETRDKSEALNALLGEIVDAATVRLSSIPSTVSPLRTAARA